MTFYPFLGLFGTCRLKDRSEHGTGTKVKRVLSKTPSRKPFSVHALSGEKKIHGRYGQERSRENGFPLRLMPSISIVYGVIPRFGHR